MIISSKIFVIKVRWFENLRSSILNTHFYEFVFPNHGHLSYNWHWHRSSNVKQITSLTRTKTSVKEKISCWTQHQNQKKKAKRKKKKKGKKGGQWALRRWNIRPSDLQRRYQEKEKKKKKKTWGIHELYLKAAHSPSSEIESSVFSSVLVDQGFLDLTFKSNCRWKTGPYKTLSKSPIDSF